MQRSALFGRAGALAGLLLSALAIGTTAADASSIYACVNKHTGSSRFVGATTKCRRTERRVTWNTIGPSGRAGAPGASGAPGVNGVGFDYASSTFGPTMIPFVTTGEVIVSKTIPAGSYFVSGKTVVSAEAKAAVFVGVVCELVDSSGTPILVESTDAVDAGEWAQLLGKGASTTYEGTTTMQLQGQLTTTQPTTLALVCTTVQGSTEATASVIASQLSALQLTGIK